MSSLIDGKSLTEEAVFEELTSILEDPLKLAGFLMLLKAKGESVDEVLGIVKAMRAQMKTFPIEGPILDIVGTGGDMVGTVNISTASALLAARCGAKVVKHGNRAVSSKSGSADVLEALGVDIHQTELKDNFAFCFAPDFHPKMKEVKKVRNALKTPTVFNLIGPLLNPAGKDHLQIGVYKEELVPMIAEVLFKLGTKRSLVYSGYGIDELSCIGATKALLVTEKGIEPILIDPEKLGLEKCTLEDLLGGTAKDNAKLIQNPPKGLRDTIILNAAVGLFLYGAVQSIQEGVEIAKRKMQFNHSLIAEIKKASPSKGKIGNIPDVAKRAKEYEAAGAAAISVLTSDRFEGQIEDLEKVRKAISIPALRKDFILTKEDLGKVKSDLVLLIVSYLGDRTEEMLKEVESLGMDAIVEVHTFSELLIALKAGAKIIGVNQRDLKDFSMHPEVYELVKNIPDQIVKIAESGVQTIEDAKRLFDMGYDAVLVGEALTRNPELCEELCSLKSVV